MEQKEPVEKKICRACGIEKALTKFPTLMSRNRAGVCRICKATGRTIVKTKVKEKKVDAPLNLGNVNINDYIKMYQYLEKSGYSLEEDIHEQFCKRYNLTPHSPKKVFNRHYSQKDCGLI